MKAAVMYENGALPAYTDFKEPIPASEDEVLVNVKAVAIKHFDKARAAGKHYSEAAKATEGRVIGGDGVCILPDGSRVYGMGVSGMMAEKATIHRDRIVPVPAGLDDAVAAALPNAVIGAAMALKFKAAVQPGDTVLINGATGFTGRVAVQIARLYGAASVIATGRNQQSLQELSAMGADEIISVKDEAAFAAQLARIHAEKPLDIVIDYLWGRSAELILASLKGNGGFTNEVRYVSVGSMAGDVIQLSAAILRSVDMQLSGSGLGAWNKKQVGAFFREIMPEMYQLAAEGKLSVKVATIPVSDIAAVWDMEVPDGGRIVVTM